MRTPLVDRLDQEAYERVLDAIEWWESDACDWKGPEWIKGELADKLCPTNEHLVLKGLLYNIEHLSARDCPCCGTERDDWEDDDYKEFGYLLEKAKEQIEHEAKTKYLQRVTS